MSMAMLWPIGLIVLSNVFYHICSKQTPASLDPLASLTVTYLVGAVVSGGLFFLLRRGGSLLGEYRKLNWTAFVLGLAIVGLEVGSIYMYKAGWQLGSGQLVHSALLAIVLLGLGCLVYREPITLSKAAGVLICLVGLYFLNK